MDLTLLKTMALLALVAIVLWLGWQVHQRSVTRKPIHGGGLSNFFSYLSGMCFVAILPTVLMSILVLHPEAMEFAGLTWHPLLLAILAFGLGSFLFALLHALVEYTPLQRALQQEAALEARGWTEQDAKSSGL